MPLVMSNLQQVYQNMMAKVQRSSRGQQGASLLLLLLFLMVIWNLEVFPQNGLGTKFHFGIPMSKTN